MRINETKEKRLSLAKTTFQSSKAAVQFSREYLTALNMGNEPDEQERAEAEVHPARYLNRRETTLWNRLPQFKRARYVQEGKAAVRHEMRKRSGVETEPVTRTDASAKMPSVYRREKTASAEKRKEQWRTQNDRKAGVDSQVQNVTAKTTETATVTTAETATATTATTTTAATTTAATTTATTATAATTSAATGGVSIALSAGKKAADKFKTYMQEKAMATEQAMQDVEQRLHHSQEVNHAMDTMPKVIRYTAATLGAIITAVSAAVVQAVFSFLTAMIAAILTVLIPLIAIIALIATIISILASLTSDTQAGYGLPTFVTEEMMQAFFETQQESGIPVSSGIAQLIVESGFGSYGPGGENGQGLSQLAYEYRNLFGIKYFSSDQFASGSVNMSTGEETDAGNVTVDAAFAVYPDYQSCIRQRAWMLRHAPYESHISPYLNRNDGNYTEEDAKHFVEGIRAAGWATAQAYVEHCFSVMERYHLYQFDNMTWEQYQEGMEGAGRYDGTVTEQMQAIVDVAQNNGSTYPCTPDMCAAWVTGVYEAAGAGVIPYGNAIDMWNTYQNTGSHSMDNIPPGAIVCGSGSGYMGSLYGHVGIYLGNGMVANNVGHFSIESLSNWISWQTATCQGYTGWIGWVYPGGVPN